MDSPFSHKRHHPHSTHAPPHQQPKPTPSEIQFRILCPASKAGGVIGKGGAVIRQLREETGARIRIIDDYAQCEERVILVAAPEEMVAQAALVRVFERMLKVDEERGEVHHVNDNGNGNGNGNGGVEEEKVVCRMLVGGNQIGSVLGRGGHVIESIRVDSGAHLRVLPRDCLPPCASPGDELLQIAGNFQAVKRALLSVSTCLQEHRADLYQGASTLSHTDPFIQRGPYVIDHHSRGYAASSVPNDFGPKHRVVLEDDVIFRLLCPVDRVGSLIGKGGSIVRGIENETGASIKTSDFILPDSDERVVVISARESIDLTRSPAQDAFLRVHCRIADACFEPGAAVVARLLVPSQHIGCLLGKGGIIITEMRRITGANIRIFGREQGPKLSTNDELVQVIGNMPSVQEALFQITSRLREAVFPLRQHNSHVSSSLLNPFSELPSPSFRPRHDQASPGHYHSPVGVSHGYDNRSIGRGPTHQSAFSHSTDRTIGPDSGQDGHYYGGDRGPYGHHYERPPSPNAWHCQAVNGGNTSRFSDAGLGPSGMVTSGSQCGQMQMISVEVVVPQVLLPHVYGENKTNLSLLTQLSGADVVVHDPKPGATEGLVLLSGSPKQLHIAQSLVQAFIFCGLPF